jgi:hypothetical protein
MAISTSIRVGISLWEGERIHRLANQWMQVLLGGSDSDTRVTITAPNNRSKTSCDSQKL